MLEELYKSIICLKGMHLLKLMIENKRKEGLDKILNQGKDVE